MVLTVLEEREGRVCAKEKEKRVEEGRWSANEDEARSNERGKEEGELTEVLMVRETEEGIPDRRMIERIERERERD